MHVRVARFLLLIVAMLSVGLAWPQSSTKTIQAGPLTIEVQVGSPTAHLFHVVDQLSGWSEYCHPQYKEYWLKTHGPFSVEETSLLAEHAKLRQRRGWGSLEPIFFTPKDLEATLSDPRLGAQDAAIERRVFAAFSQKITQLVKEEAEPANQFVAKIEAKKAELAIFAGHAARFFDVKSLRVPVYVLANPSDGWIGGGYNGGVLTLEVPRKADAFPSFLHELFHAFLEKHIPAMTAASKGVTGLDAQTLNEGFAYALSPGLLHNGGPDFDPLSYQVNSHFKAGMLLSDSYTRFNRFGLALRPLVKSALADPKATFTEVLPKAVSTWQAVVEISRAFQPPERTRIISFGPSWEILNDKVWHLGYALSAQSHVEEHYRQSIGGASKGTTVVILYTPDFNPKFRDVPESFQDLLPIPMSEVASRLAKGESLELTGNARNLKIILLAAPTMDKLKELVGKSKLIPKAPPPSY